MTETSETPDQAPGAPHPRETDKIFGQDTAQQTFLDAFNSGRLHHGWLLTGPKGIGKATLAWRIARFLLATPPQDEGGLFGAPPPVASLTVDSEHPVARRIASGGEPGLALIRRSVNEDTKRLRNEIVAEDIRRLNKFFGLSATDGGHRVVIVDAADEMNITAANALLKMLEEPPARTTLLLISHQPSRLLPTIRSRCRTLRLSPLGPADMAAAIGQTGVDLPENTDHLAALASGSVGAALRLASMDGLKLYADLVSVLNTLPRLERPRAIALADSVSGRGASDKFSLLLDLIDTALSRLAMTGAMGAPPTPEAAVGEAQVLTRLANSPAKGRAWAETAGEIMTRTRHGAAVNLDPGALVLDTVFKLQDTAAG